MKNIRYCFFLYAPGNVHVFASSGTIELLMDTAISKFACNFRGKICIQNV